MVVVFPNGTRCFGNSLPGVSGPTRNAWWNFRGIAVAPDALPPVQLSALKDLIQDADFTWANVTNGTNGTAW
jgi:hypothetical protein